VLFNIDKEKRVYEGYENPALYQFINLLRKRTTREKWSNKSCHF